MLTIEIKGMPTQDTLYAALYHVMRQFPGKAAYVKAIDQAVIDVLKQLPDFDEKVTVILHKGGGTELEYRLREARREFKECGILVNPLRSFWAISPQFQNVEFLQRSHFVHKPQEELQEAEGKQNAPKIKPLQKIYFGAPGTGKSYLINSILPDRGDDPNKNAMQETDTTDCPRVFRTTFHPDYDYATFVGAYKQVEVVERDEFDRETRKLTFRYVPQIFTLAYVTAWKILCDTTVPNDDKQVWLIIEEINRGNPATIFGDIFQLLDRSNGHPGCQMPYGFSEYMITANTEMAKWLEDNEDYQKVCEQYEMLRGGRLCLPPNLSILATMNTSDKSLFPLDTAFKRRWEWEYLPINYDDPKAAAITISIGGKQYRWLDFLKRANAMIRDLTYSEDKQMGTFFINSDMSEKDFISKVIFFLWSDVCKDEYHKNSANFMRWITPQGDTPEFTFNDLFNKPSANAPSASEILNGFMDYLGVHPFSNQ